MSAALLLFAGWPLVLVLIGYLAIEMSRRMSAEEELSRLRRRFAALQGRDQKED